MGKSIIMHQVTSTLTSLVKHKGSWSRTAKPTVAAKVILPVGTQVLAAPGQVQVCVWGWAVSGRSSWNLDSGDPLGGTEVCAHRACGKHACAHTFICAPGSRGLCPGATHSNIPAWEIPFPEDPGRLQSMGPQRVRHD